MNDPGNALRATVPVPDPGAGPLFTIGYGNRSIAQFIAVLRANRIDELIDVRSAPYSRFKPEFSREALQAELLRAGIGYLSMGDTLGGHPEQPDCYTDGKVDYEKVKTQACFQTGIQHLKSLLRTAHRLALMCSEGRPEQCHRSKLIGETLAAQGVSLHHIDEDNCLRTQPEIIHRLTGGQLDLFGSPAFTSRKRHTRIAGGSKDEPA